MEKILLKTYTNPYKDLKILIEKILGFEIKTLKIKEDNLIVGVFFNIERELIKIRSPILVQRISNEFNIKINKVLIR
jgi:hypothetical protein